jgi:NAD-dependent SIR2 family protein deacetylase
MDRPNRSLMNAIEDDSLVIFAGAGTSLNLGLPSWNSLVSNILGVLERDNSHYKNFENLLAHGLLSPLFILNQLEDDEKDTVFEILEESVALDKKQDFTLHKKLLKLSRKIITTNYDKAFEYADELPNIIHNDGKFKLARIANRSNFIFKLHGDIDNPQECILFDSQYKQLYQESAFLLGLKILFIQKTILFVGFSLSDPYVEEILNRITESFGGYNKKHFLITTDKYFDTEKYRRLIKPIIIDNYNEALDAILDDLIGYKYDQKLIQPTAHNLKSQPDDRHLWKPEQVEKLVQCILKPHSATVIEGPHGVGKTSLALEVAYLALGRSTLNINKDFKFDFVVWVSFDEANCTGRVFSAVLDEIARVTGYVRVTYLNEKDLKRKEKEINKVLSVAKILIILDNYHLIEDKKLDEWIKQVKPPNEILITSTKRLDFMNNYSIRGLDEADVQNLIMQESEEYKIELGVFAQLTGIKKLHTICQGNPLALHLLLGLIRQGKRDLSALEKIIEMDLLLKSLYELAWKQLGPECQELLGFFPLFKGENFIDRNALQQISNYKSDKFYDCLLKLSNWNLITLDYDDKYCQTHTSFLTFLNTKSTNGYDTDKNKEEFIKFFLTVAKNKILRNEPSEEYWNALVSSRMDEIDKDWRSIEQAYFWALKTPSYDAYALEIATCLTHFLDSRFYNRDRITLIEHAIQICNKKNYGYLEALFKIDGLGWTYVEESQLDRALELIAEGEKIINQLLESDPDNVLYRDLKTLAKTWRARVMIEQEKTAEANEIILSVLTYEGKAYIKYRIYMVAGDIDLKNAVISNSEKQSCYVNALKNYQLAKNEINKYGGEGGNYQINPRLGLAYLHNGGVKNIAIAEKIFESVKNNHSIYIGKLYGEYGLALVEYKRGHTAEARKLVKKVEDEISKRSTSNILLRLIKQSIQ